MSINKFVPFIESLRHIAQIAAAVLVGLCVPLLAQDKPAADHVEECRRLDEPDRAIAACSLILEAPSTSREWAVWSAYNRALAFSKKGEYDKAIADYDRALSFDPSYSLAHLAKGIEYYRKRDLPSAKAALDNAVRANPESVSALYTRVT